MAQFPIFASGSLCRVWYVVSVWQDDFHSTSPGPLLGAQVDEFMPCAGDAFWQIQGEYVAFQRTSYFAKLRVLIVAGGPKQHKLFR